eukprot:Platyproteum_vivax@DN5037_c0_g1_i1.p1
MNPPTVWQQMVDPSLFNDVQPWQRAFSTSTVFKDRFNWIIFRLCNFLVNATILVLTLHKHWSWVNRFFWYFSHWQMIFNILYLFLALLTTIQVSTPSVAGRSKPTMLATATMVVQSCAFIYSFIATVWYWPFSFAVMTHKFWFDDLTVHGLSFLCMLTDGFLSLQSYKVALFIYPFVTSLSWFLLAFLVAYCKPVQEWFGREYIYFTVDYVNHPGVSYFCTFIALYVAGPICFALVHYYFCYKFLFFKTVYVLNRDSSNENLRLKDDGKGSQSDTSEGSWLSRDCFAISNYETADSNKAIESA